MSRGHARTGFLSLLVTTIILSASPTAQAGSTDSPPHQRERDHITPKSKVGQSPMSDRLKIRFPFKNSAGANETETMWVIQRKTGYEIDNIPFHVQELALGDVIAAQPDASGVLWYSDLVQPSGHSTLHLWFADAADVTPVREALRQMGCASEVSDLPRLVAVDVPPEVPYEKVKEFLALREGAGQLEYQEACLGFQ